MLAKYENDPELKEEIISSLPSNYRSTLNAHKSKFVGNIPKTREEFDPKYMLDNLENGQKVVVLDSATDLPQNWASIELSSFKPTGNSENLFSDAPMSSDDPASGSENGPNDSFLNLNQSLGDSLSSSVNSDTELGDIPSPPRVLVFTTVELLGLLSRSRKASVDGTFKVSVTLFSE